MSTNIPALHTTTEHHDGIHLSSQPQAPHVAPAHAAGTAAPAAPLAFPTPSPTTTTVGEQAPATHSIIPVEPRSPAQISPYDASQSVPVNNGVHVAQAQPFEKGPYGADPYINRAKRNTFCCCFATRTRCLAGVCIPFLAICIAVGILVWYFWITIPAYGKGDPFVPTSADAFKPWLPATNTWTPGLTPGFPAALTTTAPVSFGFGLGMSVWLANYKNRFDIDVESVNAVGAITGENGAIPLSNFNLTVSMTKIFFPRHTNTTVQIPINLQYSGKLGDLIGAPTDPVFQLLSSSCNQKFLAYTPSGNTPPITLDFQLAVVPEIFARFNRDIKLNLGPLKLACPAEIRKFLVDFDTKYAPQVALLGAAAAAAGVPAA
ncbi:hypothetical protein HDU89_007405 [Geranomyces variabilis]|nr:hypothetical protein HDU89_007405 [Geranomyces variabilis]